MFRSAFGRPAHIICSLLRRSPACGRHIDASPPAKSGRSVEASFELDRESRRNFGAARRSIPHSTSRSPGRTHQSSLRHSASKEPPRRISSPNVEETRRDLSPDFPPAEDSVTVEPSREASRVISVPFAPSLVKAPNEVGLLNARG
jgi:hypothetical protein